MPTVLIADPSAFMRLRCARLLAENGCTTLEAESGTQALDVYHRTKPDAVFLEIALPDMNGLEVLRMIQVADPSARIAIVTALGQPVHVQEALQAGASDFVVKPFQAPRLLQALHTLLAGHNPT